MTTPAHWKVRLAFLLGLAGSSGLAQSQQWGIDRFEYPRELTDEQRFEDYSVRAFRKPLGFGAIEILKGDQRVWSDVGCLGYRIGQMEEAGVPGKSAVLKGNSPGAYVLTMLDPAPADVRIGTDVTGDGVLNLVISYWTGGASCCFGYYVFDLGSRFRLVAQLDGHEGPCGFIDLDGDSVPEFVTIDTSNSYWWGDCHACQPRPRIVLRFRDGAYLLAPDLMKRQPPKADDVKAMAQRICDHRAAPNIGKLDTYGEFGGYFSDLLYTGNPEVARVYLKQAYCGHENDVALFLKGYSEDLKKSKYWPELSQLTGDLIH